MKNKASPWYKAKWALWITVLFQAVSLVPSYYDWHVLSSGKLTWGTVLRVVGSIVAALRTIEKE